MRTPKYTEKQVRDALEKSQGLYYLAARILKCHKKTLEDYVNRYPDLKELVLQFRGARVDTVEGILWNKAVAGEPWAVIFFLKTQGRDRGYTERLEHTGKDGEALRFVVEVPPKAETVEEWLSQYKPETMTMQ